MAFCDYCLCNDCQNGNLVDEHAQDEHGRWICGTCWLYDLCTVPFKVLTLRFEPNAESSVMFKEFQALATLFGLTFNKNVPVTNGGQLQPWYTSTHIDSGSATIFLDKIKKLPIITTAYLKPHLEFPADGHLNGPCNDSNCKHRPKLITDWIKNGVL